MKLITKLEKSLAPDWATHYRIFTILLNVRTVEFFNREAMQYLFINPGDTPEWSIIHNCNSIPINAVPLKDCEVAHEPVSKFRIDVTWSCPKCDAHNHDDRNSKEGIINELYCYSCRFVFNLETGILTKAED